MDMRFIKYTAVLIDNDIIEAVRDRNRRGELKKSISADVTVYNDCDISNGRFYVCSMEDNIISAVGCLDDLKKDPVKEANRFFKGIHLSVKDICAEEITISKANNILVAGERSFFLDDADDVMAEMSLDGIVNRYCLGVDFSETMITEMSEKEIIERAEGYLSKETLLPEIQRILANKVPAGRYGHPVQYLIETDNRDLRREFYKLILGALKLSGRLQLKRYAWMDVDERDSLRAENFESLYKGSIGGTVVIRVTPSEKEESDQANVMIENIEIICKMIKRYRSDVLTVLCFPREAASLKAQFYEQLGNVSFVSIHEDLAHDEAAKDFLKQLAREKHIRSDKALLSSVKEGEGYISNDLISIFNEWYDKKLKTKIFPEYSNAESSKAKAKKEIIKCSAYDELMGLVGVSEAKRIINQAIDYFKVQKMFKDNGMDQGRPALHMVFTGNPGSAKTTCARLFARILKENGILSRGQLIELTADELKAKYVGWTAPLVKKKFKDASGGVLFLDECYSLVEDRNGSFGDEAIATIVAEMENHRNDVMCIFAGYPDKTEEFLNKNPGLRSRIAFHVPFNDYSVEELCRITEYIADGKGCRFTEDAMEKLRRDFNLVRTQPDFGNGRYCRNVVEKARLAQASRLMTMDVDKITKDDLRTIKAEDIVIEEKSEKPKQRIGFCA